MDERERALKRIDQVLEMQASPSSAYPIRARLGRAMHEVIRWAEAADRDLPLDLTWLHGAQREPKGSCSRVNRSTSAGRESGLPRLTIFGSSGSPCSPWRISRATVLRKLT